MFKTKTIQHICLGAQLKAIRERRAWSLADVSQATRIQTRYLASLEAGRYSELPQGFVQRYLRQYARVLRVNEEKVLAWFRVETLDLQSGGTSVDRPAPARWKPPVIIPALAKKAGIFLLLALFFTYFGKEIYGVLAPPPLTIETPSENWTTQEGRVTITGQTAPESSVMMNGQEVSIDERGRFAEEIALNEGVNVIRIEARKDQGRTNVVYRKILVQPM